MINRAGHDKAGLGQGGVPQCFGHLLRRCGPVYAPDIAIQITIEQTGHHVADRSGLDAEADVGAMCFHVAQGRWHKIQHDGGIGSDTHNCWQISVQVRRKVVKDGQPRTSPLQGDLSQRAEHRAAD